MGPDDHTAEWHNQVKTIVTLTSGAKPESAAVLDQMLMLYTFDQSYSRSAILQARYDVLKSMAENKDEEVDAPNA